MFPLELTNKFMNTSYAFIVGGLLVILITLGKMNPSATTGTIVGYSAAVCGLLILMGLVVILVNNNINAGIIDIISALSPFILLLYNFLKWKSIISQRI